ncbi:Sec-independent protein translocase protein TatB [Yoonia sp.]|jgi:sec-independent protein translocase protein TatB|uniref:Sec-independent protein translocase protein TatB n=1 Tax=Yoonia sp. TaxID=2212373 RepID=UPI0025D6468B|nr:Sec-independent protein translocase protein TatB [Yoonia sp.]
MFGLGMSEMVLIGIVALIVIGPKDLPGMFRTLGQFTGKAKGMAREFSRAMEAAADEAGVKDISKTIKAAANPQKFGVDKVKEATGMTKGPATQALSEERQAAKDKMSEAMAKAATDRKAKEAAAEVAPETPKGDV